MLRRVSVGKKYPSRNGALASPTNLILTGSGKAIGKTNRVLANLYHHLFHLSFDGPPEYGTSKSPKR